MEEGCTKASSGAVPSLPDGPLMEILSRVPAKSVCRFKCVSKAWLDLIADPGNRKRLRQAMQGLFVLPSEVSKVDDGQLDGISFSFSFIDLMVRSVPLDIDPCFPFLTGMTPGIKVDLSDSCNGLILFSVFWKLHQEPPSLDGYIVCNPTTRQWSAIRIPACCSGDAVSRTYLAFDPAVSSHFHLVQFQMPGEEELVEILHVYSSETGTWSQNQIDKQKEQGQLEGWHHQFTLDPIDDLCAFVNGFQHLIIWDQNVQHILVVDVQGKVRRMITMPGEAGQECDLVYCLRQSQGRLHCVTIEPSDENGDKLCIWVLQDYDTQEWVLKNTVNSLDVFGETGEMLEFHVIDIHQDCNLVFFFHQLNYELIAYDMDRKNASVIGTFEGQKSRSQFARYIPCFSDHQLSQISTESVCSKYELAAWLNSNRLR